MADTTVEKMLTAIRSRRGKQSESTTPSPSLLKIREDLANAYYDGKEWFDGRQEPERLQALFQKWEQEAEREERFHRDIEEATEDLLKVSR